MFWGSKRPKGNETLSEFRLRRMREIEEENKRKMDGSMIPVRKKSAIEKYFVKEGYWPESDTHHDIIRAHFVSKCFLVGVYIASFGMLSYIASLHTDYASLPVENPMYDLTYTVGYIFQCRVVVYVFIIPMFLAMLYKCARIHVPNMMRLRWDIKTKDVEIGPLETKINYYIDWFMFITTIVLCLYGKMITIYLNTFDVWEIMYVFNNDYNPLFYKWQEYILKAVGLWMQMDPSIEAKYFACMEFIVDENVYVPEFIPNPYNQRIGMVVNPWLHILYVEKIDTHEVFFWEVFSGDTSKLDEVFLELRTKGYEAGTKKLFHVYSEHIENYNQNIKDTQTQVCRAYNERQPLRAGRFPFSANRLCEPYPKEWLKEMAEGKR